MKSILLFIVVFAMLAFPNVNFGQAPNLGTTSGFALFTASGAFDNAGASVVTGDIGSFTYTPVGFPPGIVAGTIYNVEDPALTSAKADVGTAFGSFGANGSVLGTPLETTGFIYAGTYHTVGAADMNGDFTLDAQGYPNAIFVININGALTVGAGFNILLKNSASLCNVYWLINGDFILGAGSVFRGTIVSNGSITLLGGSSLLGRGLSTAGAISLHNNVVNFNCSVLPAAVAGADRAINLNSSTQIGAAAVIGSTFSWSSVPAGFTSTVANPTVTPLVTTTYTVVETITTTGITNSHSVVVTLNPLPAAVAGSDRTITQNTSTQIGAADVPGSTFSWSSVPGGYTSTVSNPTVSPLVTTTYTVVETITATGATNTHSVVVTVNPLPAAVAGADRAICLNASTQIGAAAVPGSTYIWSSVPAGFTSTVSNPTVSPLVTTTYTVVETITATGNTNSHNVIVTVNPIPTAIAGNNRAICLNSSTQIGAEAVPGNTYSWTSTPAGFISTTANPTVTPLVTTTYTLVETNTATGCTNSNSVVVTVNPSPAAIAGADRAVCSNTTTTLGAAAVTGSTYIWSSVPAGFTSTAANPTAIPQVTTTYTLVETNTSTGCQTTNSVTVTVTSSPPTASIISAGSATTFCANGSVTLSGNVGGTWSTGAVTPSILVNTAGDYFVTNTSGCGDAVTSNHIAVTVNPNPAAIAGADRAICLNTSTTLGAAAVMGNTYSWSSVPAGFTSTVANPTVTPLVTTTYTLVETNTSTGCQATNSVAVTVNLLPPTASVISAGSATTFCGNDNVILSGNIGGVWSNGEVTPSITVNTAGDYFVTNSSTCGSGSDVTSNHILVTVNPIPAAVAGADRAICLGASTLIGAAAVTGSTYSWSSAPAGFVSTVANPTVTPMVTTTYTVVETITATGCTKSNSVVVTVNPLPAAIAGAARIICLNTATQIGGSTVPGSIYEWTSVPVGFTSAEANPIVTPMVTTTYRVLETTAAGCSNANSVVVTVNPIPAAVSGADRVICANTSTTLGAAAITGSTYSWSSVPAGFTSTVANPTVNPLVTTTYTVVETITATGCTNTNSVIVTVNPLPAAVAGFSRTICTGTSTTLGAAAVPGSTYRWSSVPTGFTSTVANPTVSPLVTTTYIVVETNTATGCVNSNSVLVTVTSLPEAIAGANRAICLNASTQIGAVAIPGNTYSWTSVPAGFTSTEANPTVTPLVTTTYTVVEIKTNSECVGNATNSVVVTVNPRPAAIAGADRAICMNASTQIGAAANAGSTYSWTSVPAGFASTSANPTVNPLVTTTYTVVETITAIGCTNNNSVVVTVNPIPTAVAGAARTICQGVNTQIGAAAVAGSTYSWSSIPAGFTSAVANPTVRPEVTTTYTVVETTAAGCTESNSVVVTVNPAPAAIAGADRNICLNASTQIGAVAVAGSTYSWSSVPAGFTSSTANPTVTPLVTTTYKVVETNIADVCQNTNSVTVTINTAPSIISEPANQSACVGNSVSFSVNAIGTGLTYQWRKGTVNLTNGGNISGATSSTLTIYPVNSSDAASNYNVLVTGACSQFDTSNNVSLAVNAAPILSTVVCVGSSVSFSAAATGSGLTYQWRKGDVNLTDGGNISGSTSPVLTINPVSASDASTNYNVLIDGVCSANATSLNVGLIVNPAMSITAEPADQVAIVGNSAIFSVAATGTGLTYQWRKGTVNLTNGGNISGATSSTLTINPMSALDVASNYNVVVSGPCSPMITSNDASLSITGISSLDAGDTKNAVTIYPNPFTGSIDIRVNDVSKINNYELRIYNVLGEEVMNTRITKDITTLKTSNLTSGVYLFEVNSNNKIIQTGKLISKQ